MLLAQWISASRQLLVNLRFANRSVGVKRIQAIHDSDGDVARGFVLLCGIGTTSVPIASALRPAKEVIQWLMPAFGTKRTSINTVLMSPSEGAHAEKVRRTRSGKRFDGFTNAIR